ncbi:MAG TPA: PAS domain-containing sensor histidine kinase [Opitutaceae bacterium]
MRIPSQVLRSSFQPRTDWPGRNALIPPRLGYAILSIYSWTSFLLGGVIVAAILIQTPERARSSGYFWALAGLTALPLAAAALRGLPFTLRFAFLAAAIFGFSSISLIVTGMGPNWVLLVIMALSLTGMLYGLWIGLAGFALVFASAIVVAIGWVRGWLPIENALPYLDFRAADVWARVLTATAISVAGCLALLDYVLRNLRATESALRESEEKFSRAFQSGPDPMAITVLATGRFLDVNESFERLLGYPRAEALARTSFELGFWPIPADRARFIGELERTGSVRDFIIHRFNRRGERVTSLINAEGVTLRGVRCIISAERNITAREEFTRRLIAAQETERRRISAELHDSVGQHLLLVRNRAQLLIEAPGIGGFQAQAEAIRDLASHAIAEVREISHDLRPYQLDQLGLTRALQALCAAAAGSADLSLDYQIDDVDDLFTPENATHLYRIVQESLNNVFKHARARRVSVKVERDVAAVRLSVADDGRGFSVGAKSEPAAAGLGLSNIEERAHILGGTLRIDSEPNRGTLLSLTLPPFHA